MFQLIIEFLTFCLSKNGASDHGSQGAGSGVWPVDLRERCLSDLGKVDSWMEWGEAEVENERSDVRWEGVEGEID